MARILLVVTLFAAGIAWGDASLIRAFPEAEGFGAATPGGRGGKAKSKAYYVRSAYRYAYAPGVGYCFRLVLEAE